MADDEIVNITLKLDPGSTSADAQAAARQIADAIQSALAQVDLSKNIRLKPDTAKQAAEVFKKEFEKQDLGVGKAIEDSIANVDFSKTGLISGKGFGKLDTGGAPVQPGPALTPPPAIDFAKQVQPFLSGMEAVSMMLRGAPTSSILQMGGQAYRDWQVARQKDPSAVQFPGGRPGETEAARIERRLGGGPPVPPGGGGGPGAPPVPPGGPGVAGEAAGGGLLARFGLGIGGIAGGVTAFGGAAYGLTKINEQLAEMALKAAEGNVRFHDMADVMGLTSKQLLETGFHFAKSGTNIHDFENGLYRLALTAKREMPLIEREVADYSNVTAESNIKVSASERAVSKARDERQAATEHVSAAEGELVKIQTTGEEKRAEEARAAELGVSGAQLGLRAARQARVQAETEREYAPREQELADIRGPQTVKGAALGVKGAKLAADEAAYQLKAFQEGRDPDTEAWLKARKLALNAEITRNNVTNAEIAERQAKLDEEKRIDQESRGGGIVDRADQRVRESKQAEQQAELHVQQTATAKKNLEIDQAYTPLATQRNEALRKLAEAQRGVPGAADAEEAAKIELDRAKKKRDLEKYEQIPPVEHAIRETIAGRPPEGYEFGQVPPDVRRKALEHLGEGVPLGPGGIIDFAGQLLRAQKAQAEQLSPEEQRRRGIDTESRQATVAALFRSRGMQGADISGFRKTLEKQPEELTPEEKKDIERMAKRRDETAQQSERIVSARQTGQFRAREGEFAAGARAFPSAEGAIKYNDELKAAADGLKGNVAGFIGMLDRLQQTIDNFNRQVTGMAPKEEPKALEAPKPATAPEAVKPVPVEAAKPVPVEAVKSASPEAAKAEQAKPIIVPPQADVGAPLGKLTGAADSAATALNGVASAAGSAAAALNSVKPQQQGAAPAGGTGTEATNGAATFDERFTGEPAPENKAPGGLLHGAGTGTSDDIPINASAGEYLLKADTVSKIGVGTLDEINATGRIGYQEGGAVKPLTEEQKENSPIFSVYSTSKKYKDEQAKKAKAEEEARQKQSQKPIALAPVTADAPAPVGVPRPGIGETTRAYKERTGLRGDEGDLTPSGAPRPGIGETTRAYKERTGKRGDEGELTPGGMQMPRGGETTRDYKERTGLRGDEGETIPVQQQTETSPSKDYATPISFGSKDRSTPVSFGSQGRETAIKFGPDGYGGGRSYDRSQTGALDRDASPAVQSNYSGAQDYDMPDTAAQRDDASQRQYAAGGEVDDKKKKKAPPGWAPGSQLQTSLKASEDEWDAALRPTHFAEGGGVPPPTYTGSQPTAATTDPGMATTPIIGPAPGTEYDQMIGQEALGRFAGMMRLPNPSNPVGPNRLAEFNDAATHFARGGMVNGFTDTVAHIPAYSNGGSVAPASNGSESLGHHQLDLRTDAGSFTTKVDADTMDAIHSSSLNSKLSTGPKPTWYS